MVLQKYINKIKVVSRHKLILPPKQVFPSASSSLFISVISINCDNCCNSNTESLLHNFEFCCISKPGWWWWWFWNV